MDAPLLRPWTTISKRTVLDHGAYLKVEMHTVRLPDNRIERDWPWVIIPDAVIVLAMTKSKEFICFRQPKYAVEGNSLAPVGGMILNGEPPLAAAKRELLEETGFSSKEWIPLGSYAVEPNRGAGRAHLFLARNATKVANPNSDDLEDQELLFLSR